MWLNKKKNNSSWRKNKSRSCFATQGSSKVTTVINSLFEVKCHQIRIKKIVWQFSGSRISKPSPQQKNKQLESVMVYSRCSSSSPAAMQREAVLHIIAQVDSAADGPAPEPAQPPAYCAAMSGRLYLPHGPSGKVTGITTHGARGLVLVLKACWHVAMLCQVHSCMRAQTTETSWCDSHSPVREQP